MKKLLFLSLAFALALCSCRKDFEETTIIKETYQPPIIRVEGSVAGLVTDDNGTAVGGVLVRYGSVQATTDEKGLFIFENITLNAGGSFITAEADGYFQGSSRIFPQANSRNFTKIQLLPKTIVGSVESDVGGSVSFNGGAQATFEANSFVDATGAAYQGTVDVAAQWIDPTDDQLHTIMPGNLQGVNTSNQEVVLGTYGMMAVELIAENGEKLNLAEGFTSELSFPIPAALRGSAPNEIPLWHFDEAVGIWVEEGSAILQGDLYVGQVSHFSFWNCDAPFPLVHLSGRVVDAQGNPLSNTLVYINTEGVGTGSGYTDGDGYFFGKVPANEPLSLSVIDPCGETAYSTDIAALSVDTDLGDIQITADVPATTLSGTLVNCDGNPVANGTIVITIGDTEWLYYVAEDGTFEVALLTCNESTLSIQGYDTENLRYGFATDYTITNPLQVGNVEACENAIAEYIRVNLLGQQYTLIEPYGDSSPAGQTVITSSPADSLIGFSLRIVGNTVGTYTGSDATIDFYDQLSSPPLTVHCGVTGICEGMETTITEYGGPGEPIVGTFSGTVNVFQGQTLLTDVMISGDFRVNRE